jgi:hypothetical protein
MVDIVVNVYGKPWQTLCTLKSLMKNSENQIDKIYLIEEAIHPFGDNIDFIFGYFDNIIHYKPEKWVNIYGPHIQNVPLENIRHQYGIEHSNKKYVFITHNDVLYTGDIISDMLNKIDDCVAIGEIGQCWNCPAKEKLCGGGQNWNNWNPTYEDIMTLPMPHIRTRRDDIDRKDPKLMPECRVNEWACLIDRETSMKEGRPFFGEFNHDSGTEWFKAMHRKGYKFKDYRENFKHCYWANEGGYPTQQVEEKYRNAENKAKQYFEENLT